MERNRHSSVHVPYWLTASITPVGRDARPGTRRLAAAAEADQRQQGAGLPKEPPTRPASACSRGALRKSAVGNALLVTPMVEPAPAGVSCGQNPASRSTPHTCCGPALPAALADAARCDGRGRR